MTYPCTHIFTLISLYSYQDCLSKWRSGNVWDSELGRPGFGSMHGSHCVIEAGGMFKLIVHVALTSGQCVH